MALATRLGESWLPRTPIFRLLGIQSATLEIMVCASICILPLQSAVLAPRFESQGFAVGRNMMLNHAFPLEKPHGAGARRQGKGE